MDETELISRTSACIESCPDEVLIEIFTYLPVKDLKRIVMTNQTFLDIVGSSTKLMRKFALKISPKRKWDFESIASFERKHQNLKMLEFQGGDLPIATVIDGLWNVGENVKFFELNGCEVVMKNIVKIMESMKMLTDVVFVNVKSQEAASDSLKPPELKCLNHLTIIDCDLIFEIFSRARSLQEISFHADDCQNSNLASFEELLETQTNLKSLELTNIRFSNFLEHKMTVPFQLTMLTIHHCHFKKRENLEKFLESQKKLEEVDLTISNMKSQLDRLRYFEDSLAIILKQKSLTSLSLDVENYDFANVKFLHQSSNENVKTLKLKLEQKTFPLVSVLKLFPNLQSLELSIKTIDQESVDVINGSFHNLKNLKVSKFPSEAFGQLKIKSLTEVHVNETDIRFENWIEFIENNPGIKKLIINFTFFMDLSDDGVDLITRKLNLEHLELIDKWIGMRNEIYETICENCKNIKYLKLWNINVEKDFDENDKEFLRSRGIRFHLFNDESLNTPMVPF